MAGEVSSEDRQAQLGCVDREMDLIAAAIDAFLNRSDAGRFGAGLSRRAVSITILLFLIARISAVSLSAIFDNARVRLHDLRQRVHLKKPPPKWAGA